jgi:hypothetical protein
MKVQAQQLPAGQAAISTNLNPSNAIILTPLPKTETETGVLRLVVLPSPTCTRKQNTSSATKTPLPLESRNSPPQKQNNKHHLAEEVGSPA